MRIDTIRINGREYVSCAYLVFGDYGGAGSVGLANIRVLLGECEGHTYECGMTELDWARDDAGAVFGDSLTREEIINERPWLIEASGHYGSRQVWVRKPLAMRCREWMADLADYPSLDDQEVSNVEMEWEYEAWEGWLKGDLMRSLDEATEDAADKLTDGDIYECYRDAMEATNTYPEAELSGVYVDVERIKAAFGDTIKSRIV